MHIFICKTVGGKIVPQQANKAVFLKKLLDSYEDLGISYKVSIELVQKNINEHQIKLYNAYIIKAAEHFGNSFIEMEKLLFEYFPKNENGDRKSVAKWSTPELNNFINQASALLGEHGFKFD